MALPRGVMLSNPCPSCGTPGAPSDRFCGNCGARLAPAASPFPHASYPTWAPPPRNDAALVVVLVAIAVVALVIAPAAVYLLVSGFPHTRLPAPRTLGVVTSLSSDGSNWILTFTSVPTSLTQNATLLSLESASGSSLLPATTLYQLEGSGRQGVRYVPAVIGPTYTVCGPGDRILMATGNGTSQYPAGTQAAIVNDGNVLFAGILQ